MFDPEEGVLTYKCPEHNRFVRTTIRTNRQTLIGLGVFKISVWCPHCGAPHNIRGRDASLADRLPADAR